MCGPSKLLVNKKASQAGGGFKMSMVGDNVQRFFRLGQYVSITGLLQVTSSHWWLMIYCLLPSFLCNIGLIITINCFNHFLLLNKI